MASLIYDTTRFILPSKQSFSYYTCVGLDEEEDKELPIRGGTFIEILSLIIYTFISIRILVHKRGCKVETTTTNSNSKAFTLTNLEKQTIADVTSNFFTIACFGSYFLARML